MKKNTQLYDPKIFGQFLIGAISYTVTAFIRTVVASSWCGWILDWFCWSIFVYEWVFVDSKRKHISYWTNRNELMFLVSGKNHWTCLHPGRLTWNLQITHLERKMIFQTSMIMFHGNLQGGIHMNTRCYWTSSFKNSICPTIWKLRSPATHGRSASSQRGAKMGGNTVDGRNPAPPEDSKNHVTMG